MGDEGVGVRVAQHISTLPLPGNTTCLDGGTGGFHLLGPIQQADKTIIVDATADGAPAGTVRRLRPRFATEYPRTLTAHDIGLKDLLDAFYLLGDSPDVTLFAISIPPLQQLGVELSAEVEAIVPSVAEMVLEEAAAVALTAAA